MQPTYYHKRNALQHAEAGTPKVDEADARMIEARMTALDKLEGPRVGDFVIFADGVTRRVSYVWDDGVQTSDDGSFYLGDGYVSFSGALHGIVPHASLARTSDYYLGSIWVFHRDSARAHNGVRTRVAFRVYVCALPAPI